LKSSVYVWLSGRDWVRINPSIFVMYGLRAVRASLAAGNIPLSEKDYFPAAGRLWRKILCTRQKLKVIFPGIFCRGRRAKVPAFHDVCEQFAQACRHFAATAPFAGHSGIETGPRL
jgi:hypothetical protein